jgi:haloalkane dehalogenase
MRVLFEPAREIYPFESRWFASSVGRVHFIDEGTGAPILFCHGNPTWSFLYRNIVIALRDRFRCVAVDYPGFGLSDRPDGYGYTPEEHTRVVAALITHLDLRNVVIMGQDWGGPIGLATALSHPARIKGLVFGNTWFWPTDRLRNSLFSIVMSTRLMQRAILERNFFVEKLIPKGTARALSQVEMDHYRGVQPTPEARRGVSEFPRQIRAAGPWLADILHGVETALARKPLLLTWGMRDFAFGTQFIPRWCKTFPDHRLVELPDAKHFIQEDAPSEIARAIAERFA